MKKILLLESEHSFSYLLDEMQSFVDENEIDGKRDVLL